MTLSSAPEPTGMALALGIERTAWSPGHTCLEVTVTPDHLNKGGAAHGGLMTVLLDAALGGGSGLHAPGHVVVCHDPIDHQFSRRCSPWGTLGRHRKGGSPWPPRGPLGRRRAGWRTCGGLRGRHVGHLG